MHWSAVDKEAKNIAVDLTKKQIEASPSLDSDKPVSRQFEQAYYGHYLYPMYWGGPYSWGPYPYPMRDREQWKKSIQPEKALGSPFAQHLWRERPSHPSLGRRDWPC